MNTGLVASIAFAALAQATAAVAQDAAQSLPSIRLSAGIHVIEAQLARTPQQREIGLMFKKSMGPNQGMLFAFEQPSQQCFWMKNTLLPLAIAFVGDDGAIVNIDSMKPQTLDSHCSTAPVRFVLEMNEGWFVKHGIKAGQKLSGLPSVN